MGSGHEAWYVYDTIAVRACVFSGYDGYEVEVIRVRKFDEPKFGACVEI